MVPFNAKAATSGTSAESNSSHAVDSNFLTNSSKGVSDNVSMMEENGKTSPVDDDTPEVVVVSSRIETGSENQTATSEKSIMQEIRSNKTNRPYFICKYCANSMLVFFG
jgi:hypothetical protein